MSMTLNTAKDKNKKERLKPLFFVVPPGLISPHSNRCNCPQIRIKTTTRHI